MDTTKRKPTDHFREMCGKEVLNSKGMLSKKDALNLLEYYIKVHNLREDNGIIFMNDWIRLLVQESKPTIYRSELSVIVEKFFNDTSK